MSGGPEFWRNPPGAPGLGARLLSLLPVRSGRLPPRARPGPVPQIGIVQAAAHSGDLVTPAAIALALHLAARRQAPVISVIGGPGPVDLLRAFAPVVADPARPGAGAGTVVVHGGWAGRGPSLLAVLAHDGFGNARPRPAGPLAAPLPRLLAGADLLLLVGSGAARRGFLARWAAAGLPPVLAARLTVLATGMDWAGLRVLAVSRDMAGPLAAALRGEGAEVLRTVVPSGHGVLAPALCARLAAEARALGAQIVGAEAEAALLPPAFRRQVLTLPLRLEVADWQPFDVALAKACAAKPDAAPGGPARRRR